jgi:outer membrane protein insertion porin family
MKQFIPILAFTLLTACSGLRTIPEGDKLYTGAEIRIESTDHISNKKFLKDRAKSVVRPIPNQSILGLRPKLALPNFKWLQKFKETPVLMSSVRLEATKSIIDALFFNNGIFNSYTEYKIVEKKHTAMVLYICHLHQPYKIKNLILALSEDSIASIIRSESKHSLVKTNDTYQLDMLKLERIRLDAVLKDKGYFYFSPDYLLYKADTTNGDGTVTLKLMLKDSIPTGALLPYRIREVIIDQDFSLNSDTAFRAKDTMNVENYIFLGQKANQQIRPKILLKSIYLKKGDVYSRKNHDRTLNGLMSLGNYKFVRVKFEDFERKDSGELNATILMTPFPKYTFSAEIDVVSKSNGYTGPRLQLSLLSRNGWRYAELIKFNLSGSYEAQWGQANLFSYAYAPQLDLNVPGLLLPFRLPKFENANAFKTHFSLSYNYLKRVNYFDMRTFQIVAGYRWKPATFQEMELNPVQVSYTSLANQSETFTALLLANPFLKKSYEEQFIAGGTFSFTFDDQPGSQRKLQHFVRVAAETAGNLFSLVNGKSTTLLGSAYAQFSKLSIDGRVYYTFADKNKIVLRMFAGAGVPYGNSSVLPYSKQFFSGGPNSIRAFAINSLGPGTYHQDTGTEGFLQLGGDIKLEANTEYRFTIYKFLKGAFFLDAGNCWLIKSNDALSIKPFSFSTFMDELAVGAGFGLRMDVSFFILRFDLATPLRKPWSTGSNKWVMNQTNLVSSTWRRENLILNVAIGYPF